MTPQEILDKVIQIQDERTKLETESPEMTSDERKSHIMDRHRDFAMNHPATFISAVDGALDIERLRSMVNMANRVRNNELTQHEASVKVGSELVDTYVKPVLDKSKSGDKGGYKGRGKVKYKN